MRQHLLHQHSVRSRNRGVRRTQPRVARSSYSRTTPILTHVPPLSVPHLPSLSLALSPTLASSSPSSPRSIATPTVRLSCNALLLDGEDDEDEEPELRCAAILELGSWVGVRRPFHLFLFSTASCMVFPPGS